MKRALWLRVIVATWGTVLTGCSIRNIEDLCAKIVYFKFLPWLASMMSTVSKLNSLPPVVFEWEHAALGLQLVEQLERIKKRCVLVGGGMALEVDCEVLSASCLWIQMWALSCSCHDVFACHPGHQPSEAIYVHWRLSFMSCFEHGILSQQQKGN